MKIKRSKNQANKEKKSQKNSANKIATLAVFTSLSLITFLIENLFPPLIIPGAKMGLSNIFSLTVLIMYGPIEAFAVVIVRTILGAIFAGNVSMLLYSFTGGIVSMMVSAILLYTIYPKVSLLSISIVAAICHNMTQNIVFVILYSSPVMFSYMPYLALIGIVSGIIVGGVTMLILKKVPDNIFLRALKLKGKTE